MTSVLVPLAGVKVRLGLGTDDTSQDEALTPLIDEVEAAFLADCGRDDRPFQDAEAGRVELHDGNDLAVLWLDYEVASLSSVLLGLDASDPDETLDVADPDILIWVAGKARLARVDGGFFGHAWQPNYVQVTYDARADLPVDARNAITAAVAAIMNRRGAEGQAAERIGPYSTDYLRPYTETDEWQRAVAHHRVVTL